MHTNKVFSLYIFWSRQHLATPTQPSCHQASSIGHPTHPPFWWRNTWMVPYIGKPQLTSDPKKLGQSVVVIQYCGMSQFFWIRRYLSLFILAFQLNHLATFAIMLFLDHIRHIENKHETVKKGECSRCHKQFGTKSSAERHEQKCILNFTVPDSIPSEIMNSFPKEKETVKRIMSKNSLTKKCPLCNLFFEKRSNLRRHVLRNNVLANLIFIRLY